MPLATQPGEARLPADGGLGGSQAGRWEGVAGGRQGPWRAQAPPGWVPGQERRPPPKLSVTAPRAPRRTSPQIHSLAAVYSGPGAQMNAALTAVQLPPAHAHRYTQHRASPHRPRPPFLRALWPLDGLGISNIPVHHTNQLPAQPHRRHFFQGAPPGRSCRAPPCPSRLNVPAHLPTNWVQSSRPRLWAPSSPFHRSHAVCQLPSNPWGILLGETEGLPF